MAADCRLIRLEFTSAFEMLDFVQVVNDHVGREDRQQHHAPAAERGQQQAREQNRVRRPQRRDRSRLQGERKPDLRAQVIAQGDEQC